MLPTVYRLGRLPRLDSHQNLPCRRNRPRKTPSSASALPEPVLDLAVAPQPEFPTRPSEWRRGRGRRGRARPPRKRAEFVRIETVGTSEPRSRPPPSAGMPPGRKCLV
jgi:hypothetical protein